MRALQAWDIGSIPVGSILRNSPSSSVAERRTENPEVSGSMPLSGISTFCEVAGLASETAQLRYFSEKEITTQGTETS